MTLFRAPWQRPSSEPSSSAKAEILGLLARPGCMFCHEEVRQLQSFYFWYLAEQYFESHSIEQMRRSIGFCQRHTRRLLSAGPHSTVARVYSWMLPPYLQALRALEGAPFGRHRARLAQLRPSASCSACSAEVHAVESRLFRLKAALDDPEVQDAFARSSALCLSHFLTIAPTLAWRHLSVAGQAILGQLCPAAPGKDAAQPLVLLKGLDPAASLRRSRDRTTTAPGSRIMAGAGRDEEGTLVGTWSPTLEDLQLLLRRPGCPVCHVQHEALRDYFDWLAVEVCTQPRSRWEDAIWLCRVHAWEFAASRDGEAAATVAQATAGYWQSQLERLRQEMADEPAAQLVTRLARWQDSVRRAPSGQRPAEPTPHQLWQVLQGAMESPGSRLASLRQRLLRQHDCPACRARETGAARISELIAVAMGDASTKDVYQHASGLCYRHLPRACAAAHDADQLRTLAGTERARLEALQWELEEVLRKESWSVRYEPRRGETSAWRRAAAQVSGSFLDEDALLGL